MLELLYWFSQKRKMTDGNRCRAVLEIILLHRDLSDILLGALRSFIPAPNTMVDGCRIRS
jgi:hypothetical protein